jgi:hypothetical protein
VDDGWCWWPRKYRWLPEGFFCPEHDTHIKAMIASGVFDDWPLDMSPEVLEMLEAMAEFHLLDSREGREIVAGVNRASFQIIDGGRATGKTDGKNHL